MASTLHPLACNKTTPMDLHVWRWVPSVGVTAVPRQPRYSLPSIATRNPQILPQMRPHSNLKSNLKSVPLRWLSTSLRIGRRSWCRVGRHSPCP
uniref:Uncharacterized protein n=1 Tax=Setaria viridis TaxID=4556 RepID=A0A4U6W7L1_SETVI|nr:hypothetical protein SEVIR_1G114400v2 [Setaria viridis]